MLFVQSNKPVVRLIVIAKRNPRLPETCYSLLHQNTFLLYFSIPALTLDSNLHRQNNSHARLYSIIFYMRKCMYGDACI